MIIMIPISLVRKPRFKRVKKFAQSHPESTQQSLNTNPVLGKAKLVPCRYFTPAGLTPGVTLPHPPAPGHSAMSEDIFSCRDRWGREGYRGGCVLPGNGG